MREQDDIKDGRGRPSGIWYWTLGERRAYYQDLAQRIDGTHGDLVQLLPRQADFTIDSGDLGRIMGYYRLQQDRSGWHKVDTARPYFLQGEQYLDNKSMPYAGAMWYAFDFDLPASVRDKPVHFCVPALRPQAWVWVNGEYVGRRKYLNTYVQPSGIDIPITDAIRTGKKNLIVVRISTGANRTQAPEGLAGRAFLYSPHPGTTPLGTGSGH